MNISYNINVIITAGGNSIRFGSNKLLEKINGITVIEAAVSKFIDIANKIVIPAGDEVKKYLEEHKLSDKILFAHPGETRQKSVYNALNLCDDEGIILIHDGARPFVDSKTIFDVIEKVKKRSAAIAGSFAIDTIKVVKDNKILKTIDRNTIFCAHTPQGFSAPLIKKLHEKYKESDFTDDALLLEQEGIDIYIVEDNKNNIKITTRADILLKDN